MWIRQAALVVLIVLLAGVAPNQAAPDQAAAARHALDVLLAGKLREFSKLLAPVAQERLNPVFLRDRVAPEVAGFGDMKEIGTPLIAPSGTSKLISFPVRFSRVTLNVQFTIDDAGRVAGLFFRPADAPLPPEWKQPLYSKPERFHETEITVGSDEWKLPGTLTLPVGKGPFPGIVLVHGPGPNDRDETIYSNHMFRDLAEGLASRGFAVLRYDKRTFVYREKMSGLDFTLQQETVEDAGRALSLLRRTPAIDPKRIYVIAHSLGGYALARIAKQDDRIAAAVVLAGNARPIEDVVLDQAIYTMQLKPALTAEDNARLDGLKGEVSRVKKLNAAGPNPPIVLGLPAGYLLDLRNYNPVLALQATAFPILFLQGERDFQVTLKDFNLWKQGLANRKNVSFQSYPSLNHLFMAGEGKPSPAEYRVPGNVSAQVITDIAAYLQKP